MDNEFYNKNKGGVDTLDQLIESFSDRFVKQSFQTFRNNDLFIDFHFYRI
jgi:hypothetical protein